MKNSNVIAFLGAILIVVAAVALFLDTKEGHEQAYCLEAQQVE